jgi:hypothetical protein
MIAELEHLVRTCPEGLLFAVLFVGICLGIGNTIGRVVHAEQPRSRRGRRT